MASLFERAFLQAIKKRQIHHPARLKAAIRSFNTAYFPQCNAKPDPAAEILNSEPPHAEQAPERRTKKTRLSTDMAGSLMRHGFGVIPQCMARLIE
jgi:hypothetical protein